MVNDQYLEALKVTNEEQADALFSELVSANMRSAGRARTRREAEKLERRKLEYVARGEDQATRLRMSRLFGLEFAKDQEPKKFKANVKSALPRPGRQVANVGTQIEDIDLDELRDLMERQMLEELPPHPPKKQKRKKAEMRKPRRDRWRPWSLGASAADESSGWKPMSWIEV